MGAERQNMSVERQITISRRIIIGAEPKNVASPKI